MIKVKGKKCDKVLKCKELRENFTHVNTEKEKRITEIRNSKYEIKD